MQVGDLSLGWTTARHIQIVGDTAAEVVSAVGGWLFDHTHAGWQATVLLTAVDDTGHRCLRILGAGAVPMHAVAVTGEHAVDTLMVAMTELDTDPACRAAVHNAVNLGLSDVLLFGHTTRSAMGIKLRPVRHTLSGAARAFKREALTASGAPATVVGGAETFVRAGSASETPGASLGTDQSARSTGNSRTSQRVLHAGA